MPALPQHPRGGWGLSVSPLAPEPTLRLWPYPLAQKWGTGAGLSPAWQGELLGAIVVFPLWMMGFAIRSQGALSWANTGLQDRLEEGKVTSGSL